MSSYKKYPKYENVSFPFLDEIPSSWVLVPLYALSNFKQGKLHEPYIDEDGEFICVNSRFVSTEGKKFKHCNINLSPVEKSDILMVMSDLPNGRALAKALFVKGKNNYALNQRVCAITPTNIYPKFLYYQLNRNAYFLSFDDGSNQTNLSNYDFKKYPVLLPSKQEQQTIANYLDIATAKIDTLIEKQTRLIELLKEKRQAVISTAVTRGLDDTVAMKDSGVEWLGDIPEGWIVTKIKNMLATPVTDGPHETPEFLDEGVPFVSAEAISKGYINFNKIRGHISQEDNKKYSQKYSPELHDVYMIKSGATTGITAIVDDRVDFNIWSPLAVFRSNVNLEPYYLLNYLRSANFQKAVELYWTYGTQQNIGMNVLENLYISIPPLQEQQAIASHLDDKTSKIDKLITKSTKAIDLLKEKRTALISSVVTGKIDVREVNEKGE